MLSLIRAGVVAAALAALPAGLAAQQKPAPAAPAAPAKPQQQAAQPQQDEARAMFAELQQIGARLQSVQAQALADPALKTEQETLGAEIQAAILKADPTLNGLTDRVRTLESGMQEAQQKGDQAKFQQLLGEGQQLEARFLKAQESVLQQPSLAARTKAFQEKVEKKMLQIEPQIPALLSRGQQLQSRLQTSLQAQQKQQQQPPAPKKP